MGALGLGKSCFIRNVAVSIPGAELLHAHLADPDAAAPAPTSLRAFRAAPEALCSRFDVGSLANDNAVFHFCFQVLEAGAIHSASRPGRKQPSIHAFHTGNRSGASLRDSHNHQTVTPDRVARCAAMCGTALCAPLVDRVAMRNSET